MSTSVASVPPTRAARKSPSKAPRTSATKAKQPRASTTPRAPKAPSGKTRNPRVSTTKALVPVVSLPPEKIAKPAGKPLRTSQRLRNLLKDHPEQESFTIEEIVTSLGEESFGTSLMFFAIPEVLPIPVPAISALVVLPTAAVSTQMIAGRKRIKLPKFLLRRSVPRKALAGAIFAILPVLERAERRSKRRLEWATTPNAQRLLGLFVFLLSMAIAVPIPGFNMPQAIAIFIIGLGLVEKDGLIVAAGVVVGLLSLVLLAGAFFGLFSFLGL